MEFDNKWTVYMHISPSNKRYIGITSKEPKKRWGLDGRKYHHNKHFINAIEKYGWDNFQHIIVAKGLDEETAKWLEIELIREWDTTNPNKGYNVSPGGNVTTLGKKYSEESKEKMSERKKGMCLGKENPKSKRIICVELRIIFDTVNEAASFINRSQGRLSQVLKNGERAGGYHWKYVDEEEGE